MVKNTEQAWRQVCETGAYVYNSTLREFGTRDALARRALDGRMIGEVLLVGTTIPSEGRETIHLFPRTAAPVEYRGRAAPLTWDLVHQAYLPIDSYDGKYPVLPGNMMAAEYMRTSGENQAEDKTVLASAHTMSKDDFSGGLARTREILEETQEALYEGKIAIEEPTEIVVGNLAMRLWYGPMGEIFLRGDEGEEYLRASAAVHIDRMNERYNKLGHQSWNDEDHRQQIRRNMRAASRALHWAENASRGFSAIRTSSTPPPSPLPPFRPAS